ncbi:hypothetical protein REPUB_Repub07fG0206200 [Reevesia pubescens]
MGYHQKQQNLSKTLQQDLLPRVLVLRSPSIPLFFFFKSQLQEHFHLLDPLDSSEPTHSFLSRHAPSVLALLCVGSTRVSSETLSLLPSLKLIVASSAGIDHIDLQACLRRGIAVTSAGQVFSEDVADFAVGLLIDVLRRVSASDEYVRSGFWVVKGPYPLGVKLGGKRVGIVGLGSIGSEVAKRLSAFGCSISYTSRKKKQSVPFPFYGNARDLATNSDILILCCALTEETHHIINKDVMVALGEQGVIINVGRGSLIDEKELVQCLVQGEIGGAGLDVFENEPNVPKELFGLDNVVLSPHCAAITPQSLEALLHLIIANLKAFFSNKPLLQLSRLFRLPMATAKEEELPRVLVHRPPNFHFPFKHRLDTQFRLLDPLDSDPHESTYSFFSRHADSIRVLLCVDPTPISRNLLSLLPSLQLIVCSSAGVDHVDLQECRRWNIAVTNAGKAFSPDVADLAVGLLIDVLRRVSAGDRYVRAGLWARNGEYPLGFKVWFFFLFFAC